jgi:hypothetical protein
MLKGIMIIVIQKFIQTVWTTEDFCFLEFEI